MNGQKLFSLITIFAALTAGAIDACKPAHAATVSALPSVSAVMPDLTPLDLSATGELHAPTRIAILDKHTSAMPTLSTWSRVWTCGEPRPLDNDPTQTVRECGWSE